MAKGPVARDQQPTPSLDDRILQAARELFFDKGYYATSTREIASKAGTSESGIFRRFNSKYGVLMAIYNDCWKQVNKAIDDGLPKDCTDPREQILSTLRILWELYVKKHPLMNFIIINTGNTDTLLIERKENAIITDEDLRYIKRLEEFCKECMNQQLIRGLTVGALREGLLGISEGILLGWYLADNTPGRYPGEKVSIAEALDLVSALLYANTKDKPGDSSYGKAMRHTSRWTRLGRAMARVKSTAIVSFGLFVAFQIGEAPMAQISPSTVERREEGQLVLENIPKTPPALAESLRRYDNVQAVHFEDWLADGTMLVKTRFGEIDQIHRVAFPGGPWEQLTFDAKPVDGALARPGRRDQFLFWHDSLLLTTIGGADRTIARNILTAPVFSRDGTRVAWSSLEGDEFQLWIMDVDQPSTSRRFLRRERWIAAVAFSRDGRTLVYSEWISKLSQQLFLLEISTGMTRRLTPDTAEILYDSSYEDRVRAHFTPDGNALLLTSNEGRQFGHVIRADLASGASTPLGPTVDADVELIDLSPDDSTMAYVVNEQGYSKVYLLPLIPPLTPDSARLVPEPQTGPGVVRAIKFSPDSKRLAISIKSATSPEDVWTFEPGRTDKLERWTQSEIGGLNLADFVKPSLIHFTSFDGWLIPAFLYKPEAVPTTPAPLPVIIWVHGGPEAQERPEFQDEPRYQYWVRHLGAAVIAPNIRGSAGYGRDYLTLDNGVQREDAVKDIKALLDWIANRPQEFDLSRVVVAGDSYGGFMALWVLYRYGNRIAGAYSDVGMSSLLTFLQSLPEWQRVLRRFEYGDERDPMMRQWMENIAPLNHTRKMIKPLFVVAGANDRWVPVSEANQLVTESRANGVDVSYLLAKDEGHIFRKKENRRAVRAAEILWLQKVLRLNAAQ